MLSNPKTSVGVPFDIKIMIFGGSSSLDTELGNLVSFVKNTLSAETFNGASL